MSSVTQNSSIESVLQEQRRFTADTADYLLEQLARAMETPSQNETEKEDTLNGLLEKIGDIALDSKHSSGQTIMNRAFHVAKSHADQKLADKVDTFATGMKFRRPSEMSLEALI